MDKRKQDAAKKIISMIEWRSNGYKTNTMYPAYCLNAMAEECDEIAEEIRQMFDLPKKEGQA